MAFNSDRHHRRSIRLRDYDYSCAGAYFVTICTIQRKCLFGEVVDGKMVLNDTGQTIATFWKSLPVRYTDIEVDDFVVMPNHIHGIIVINEMGKGDVGAIHELPDCYCHNRKR